MRKKKPYEIVSTEKNKFSFLLQLLFILTFESHSLTQKKKKQSSENKMQKFAMSTITSMIGKHNKLKYSLCVTC